MKDSPLRTLPACFVYMMTILLIATVAPPIVLKGLGIIIVVAGGTYIIYKLLN